MKKSNKTILLVALILLCLVVVIWLFGFARKAPVQNGDLVSVCKTNLNDIQSKLENYYSQNGQYPLTLQDLKNGSEKDPWNNKYRYNSICIDTGVEGDDGKMRLNYVLGSNGPDGKPDTVDDVEPSKDAERHSFKILKQE